MVSQQHSYQCNNKHSTNNNLIPMKATLVLAALVGLANARPEPPSGYSYPSPGGLGLRAGGGGLVGGGGHGGGGGGGGFIGGGIVGGGSSFSQSIGFSGGHSGGISGGFSSGGVGGGIGGGIGSGFSSGISSGISGGYAGGYSQAPIVQKHIYVHVPPPEPVELRPQRIPLVAPPRKHYKIIFIKAPTPPTPTAPIIPLQPQNEEKTLVYVLVKKPEEQPDIIIPTPAPTQPSKPEVYFIKYKSQTEGGVRGGISLGAQSSGISIGQASLDGGYGPPGHVPGSPIR